MILIQVHLDNNENFLYLSNTAGFSPKYKYKGGEIVMNSSKFNRKGFI
jgi:hypothetical protein